MNTCWRALDVLSGFDFREIREDILGFTYEAYIDEVARSKKGHFLTRAELVEMILSEAGYQGREILGRRLLDPASGSGSFLVQAARRLRRAIFVLYGTDPGLEVRKTALDEAWDVKHDGRERFHFIVGNPPYVNRGIVTDAPSYGEIPFYRRILSGDSNTFLLFMRLAQHYAAPRAVLSFVVPINLLGDASSMAARELLASRDWHVEGVVRFYRRDVLFTGVLQRVCVFTARRVPEAPPTVKVRGGNTVEEACDTVIEAAYENVTQASPDELNGRCRQGSPRSRSARYGRRERHFRDHGYRASPALDGSAPCPRCP